MLRSSIAYFRKQCSDDGSDALRTASIKEALPRLEGILSRLEEEIASTEERLRKARAQVDGSQDAKLKLLEENLTRPENQTVRAGSTCQTVELSALLICADTFALLAPL